MPAADCLPPGACRSDDLETAKATSVTDTRRTRSAWSLDREQVVVQFPDDQTLEGVERLDLQT